MAYSYKGSISFGLVYIPITLHSTIKNNDISFNMIDKKTHNRVKYKKTCVDCDERELSAKDIVKGYEYEEDKYIIFEDADFEKIKTKKDKNITIENFVNLNEVDPLYFDRPYYVVPTGAEKAYQILLVAMEQEKKCAIAKCVLGSKETLILIRANMGEMLLNTLFFYEEVQTNPAKAMDMKFEGSEQELKMAKAIIDSMTVKFEPQKYKDEYREKLLKAIETKIEGKQIAKAKDKKTPKVTNLMDALKQSLENVKPKKTTKKLQDFEIPKRSKIKSK